MNVTPPAPDHVAALQVLWADYTLDAHPELIEAIT